jgi:SAM-dependent methyltransferase
VSAEIADFASLPFPDNLFDAAFAMNSLLHVPPEELSSVLLEISRVLVRGTTLLIVVWGGITRQGFIDGEWLDPPRYFSTYTDDDLVALETPGFRHESFYALDIAEDDHNLHSQILTLEAT